MKWIAVKDKLPEDQTEVLVYYRSRNELLRNSDMEYKINAGMYFETDNYWNIDTSDWDNETPTHWMPLPEPPQIDP